MKMSKELTLNTFDVLKFSYMLETLKANSY